MRCAAPVAPGRIPACPEPPHSTRPRACCTPSIRSPTRGACGNSWHARGSRPSRGPCSASSNGTGRTGAGSRSSPRPPPATPRGSRTGSPTPTRMCAATPCGCRQAGRARRRLRDGARRRLRGGPPEPAARRRRRRTHRPRRPAGGRGAPRLGRHRSDPPAAGLHHAHGRPLLPGLLYAVRSWNPFAKRHHATRPWRRRRSTSDTGPRASARVRARQPGAEAVCGAGVGAVSPPRGPPCGPCAPPASRRTLRPRRPARPCTGRVPPVPAGPRDRGRRSP
ncbi:hypothetical protein STENM36S_06189 [Streptomyces tendae]